MSVSLKNRLVSETLQPIEYNNACSKKSACERYNILETHKVKLTTCEKYKHAAIVAVLGLATISFVGIYFLEILSNAFEMETGIGLSRLFDSWDKMRAGEKTTFRTVQATEKKIKKLADKQFTAKVASAEIHFEKWVRNQQNEDALRKAFTFLHKINSCSYSRFPFLNQLPQILKDLGKTGQQIVKNHLDILGNIYSKESDKYLLSEIVKGHFNKCSTEELLQANEVYSNPYQLSIRGI